MQSFAAEVELCIKARCPLLYLVTHEEERVLAALDSVAQRLGARLYAWTQVRGMGPAHAARWDARLCDPSAALEHIAAGEERSVYALLDFHPFLTNPAAVRRLKDTVLALRGSARCVVLVSPLLVLPPEIAKDVTVIDVPLPGPTELGHALDANLARVSKSLGARVVLPESERERLVRAAQGLTLKEFADALAKAIVARGTVDAETADLVQREKRQVVRKTGVLEYVETEEGLGSVGGLEPLKRWLEARGQAFGERAQRFGLPAPKGLLLVGVQGAGKSLCARAAAAQWRMPLLRLDVGAIFDSAVGASEANLRHAIALAEGISPCVLWVDEVDKGFARIEGSAASDAGTASRVFGTFVTWLQEKRAPVFVIATANAIEALPPELARKGRFDEVFFVDLPGPAERLEILRIHLVKRERDPSAFDLEALAEAAEGYSGAEIEQAVVAGLFHAFEAGRKLETRDILRALRETVPLSRTMSEQIEALRKWAAGRARPASSASMVAGRRVTV